VSKKTKPNANNIKHNNGLKHIHNYKRSPDQSQSYWIWRLTHYDTNPIPSVETQDCRHL